MERIRVLQVNKAFSPHIGGVEQVVKDIVENLSDKCSSTVLVCNPPNGKYSEEELNNIKIVRCSKSARPSSAFFGRKCPLRSMLQPLRRSKRHDVHVPEQRVHAESYSQRGCTAG